MKKYRDIYWPMKVLYEISKESQKNANLSLVSTMTYLKEFCTIRVGTSRRGGHDYGIVKFLQREGLGTLVISPNIQTSHIIAETYHKVDEGDNRGPVMWETIAGMDNDRLEGYLFDMVIVNVASLMSKSKEEKLYDVIRGNVMKNRSKDEPFYLVFVQ